MSKLTHRFSAGVHIDPATHITSMEREAKTTSAFGGVRPTNAMIRYAPGMIDNAE